MYSIFLHGQLQFHLQYLGVVFAFVWASFLPPVRRNTNVNDINVELIVNNNNEKPKLMVSY